MSETIYYTFFKGDYIPLNEDLGGAKEELEKVFDKVKLEYGVLYVEVERKDNEEYVSEFVRYIKIGEKVKESCGFTNFNLAFYNPTYLTILPRYSSRVDLIDHTYEWDIICGVLDYPEKGILKFFEGYRKYSEIKG